MSTQKPRRASAAFLLAGVAALSQVAVADAAPWHGHRGERGGGFERLAEHLELTEAQRSEAEVLHRQWLGDLRERFEANAASFDKIHAMAAAENPDATAIGELVIQLHRERAAMKAARGSYRTELVKLLTPEQAEKLETWEAARPWGDGFRPHRRHGRFHDAPFRSPQGD